MVFLILLASFGIGIGGAPPVPPRGREQSPIEWVENKEEKEEETEQELFKT
ncbi:hypothetical protein B0O44_103465 [Pedobacter nutrimenti]|uniref:Uncharacterized protein n=2 Tax=Pedobacter nutrimenti TaxID=1241337 RepID=A0A318UTR1_9SPHI|nr:hypothetical protein B0O44_103465 [Pedobacter nutrimenti]